MSWNPDQYERFRAQRRQPFDDLAALIAPHPHMRLVDLGCGTGELTRELHAMLGAAETTGVDSSAEMLAKAKPGEGLRFVKGEIESFAPEHPVDLVFSNAAIHWVDDHEALLARLTSFLAPNGQLAIQAPANRNARIAHDGGRTAVEAGHRAAPLTDAAPERYAEILHRLGATKQDVRLQIYGHLLDSSADVVEWVKGTLLTDYERRAGDRYPEFLARYREKLHAKIGDVRPYFFTYRRILMWGQTR